MAQPQPVNLFSASSTVVDSTEAPPSGASSYGSFRQQLDHLLTQRERSELKRALQIYAEKRYGIFE